MSNSNDDWSGCQTVHLSFSVAEFERLLSVSSETQLPVESICKAAVLTAIRDGAEFQSKAGRSSRSPPTTDPYFCKWLESWGIPDCLESRKMADFFAAKGGKAGRKLDWSATWRNWARRAGVSFSSPAAKVVTVMKRNPLRPGEFIEERRAQLNLKSEFDDEGV